MSLGRVRVYNPREMSIIVCGIPIPGGYADGEFFKTTSAGPWFTWHKGTDGEYTRSDTGENGYNCTLTLMQSNPVNAILSALLTLDRAQPNGAGIAPTLVKDRLGSSLFSAPSCCIMDWPEETWSAGVEARAWPIFCVAGNAPHIVGGNG